MLIIAQYADGTEFRFPPDNVSMNNYDALVAFGQWLLTDVHKGYTVFAHNNRGYDGYFIMAYLLERACKASSVIYRGTQLLNMEYKSLKLKFRDTLNYVSTTLAKFPAVVDLDINIVAKGDFPHKLNKPENWDRILAFPTVNDFYTCVMLYSNK